MIVFHDNSSFDDEELDSLYEQKKDREIQAMIRRQEKNHHETEQLKPFPEIKPITTKLKEINQ